jgi:hypothetical protein
MTKKNAVEIPIEWVFPPDVETRLATNAVVQFTDDLFFLSFFEILPPLILSDTDEEKKAQLESIDAVEAKCVARVALTPDQTALLMRALSQVFDKWQSHRGDQED